MNRCIHRPMKGTHERYDTDFYSRGGIADSRWLRELGVALAQGARRSLRSGSAKPVSGPRCLGEGVGGCQPGALGSVGVPLWRRRAVGRLATRSCPEETVGRLQDLLRGLRPAVTRVLPDQKDRHGTGSHDEVRIAAK